MNINYTNEKNIQIIISLLKQHNIKKIIASPGTQNMTFVASVQHDSFFEVYSSIDERSAAYIACGLSEESKEPVVLVCTGATASRNYIPGLTEAYYRKIPILALTATARICRVGNNIPQVIDRSNELNDIVKKSILIEEIHNEEEEQSCINNVNDAILELKRNGGGPVHINYVSIVSRDYDIKVLPVYRKINRHTNISNIEKINKSKIAIFIGAHNVMEVRLIKAIEKFCEINNGVVICDQTSNYHGKYGISASLILNQTEYISECKKIDLLIDIGNVSGAYMKLNPKDAWRVNPDGEIKSRSFPISNVFQMEEIDFFESYCNKFYDNTINLSFYDMWKNEDKKIRDKIQNIPFSNPWIAQRMFSILPQNSVLYLGILNSLRSWNYCELLMEQSVYCNTGGFGIDGTISSLLGASLSNLNKIYIGICGDLAFFYDMNALGNKHIGNNFRLMIINNGKGTEFKNYFHQAYQFGEEADKYIAAGGHYGNQSKKLIKHYAEDLGYEYLSADSKESFEKNIMVFLNQQKSQKPIVFEVFTDSKLESEALKYLNTLEVDLKLKNQKNIKKTVQNIVGKKRISKIKKILNDK